MHVSLTRRLEEYVREKVKGGRYNNASEVIREALRVMEQQDDLRQIKLDRLREAIELGELQVARGDLSERAVGDIIADNEALYRK
jgi:antitoxin ParD1/3/4